MQPRKFRTARRTKAREASKPSSTLGWEVDQKNVATVFTEITDNFETNMKSPLLDPKVGEMNKSLLPSKELVEACARVGAFFMDRQAFSRQLIRLNNLLKPKVGDGEITVSILRETLEEELAKVGFFPHFAKALENLRPEIFRATLDEKMLIKDAIIGDTPHGEFSHAIQALALAWQQEEYSFLNIPVLAVFEFLASEEAVFYRDPLGSDRDVDLRREEKSIWDLVFDYQAANNFRSPEFVHKFILESTDENIALLKSAIKKRVEKRTMPGAAEEFLAKHQTDGTQQRIFTRKDNKTPYVANKAPGLLVPEDSKIDIEQFKNRK